MVKKWIYLDHASGGPIPRPVLQASRRYLKEHFELGDLSWAAWIKRREEVRKKAARLINADPSEITFIQSTSQGMNLIADLLADQGAVLTNASEFPASTLPWIWRKARMIWQNPENSAIRLDTLRKLLSPEVKTILTSFVQYATGFRQDLEALGRIKGNRFLVVNATQGFGAFPINVKRAKIDFLCTNSYKWLMAGYGGGILYMKKDWMRKFKPSQVGWRSMREPELMDNRRLDLKPEASRYELGCPSFPSIFALGAAVDYLSEIGIEKISRRILELTDFLIDGLERSGLEVVSPRERTHRSGIVVFKMSHAEKVCRRLLRDHIYVSPRGAGIRVAPHCYNTFEEIETFLNAL